MTTRKKKSEKVVDDLRASAHKIWLAGLGAVSLAEEEGSRTFKNLVSRGQTLEERGKKSVSSLRTKAGDAWDSLEEGFEARMVKTLRRLGVPTRDDLERVSRRLDRLEAAAKAARNARPAARKKPGTSKKKTTRKSPKPRAKGKVRSKKV
jgi:poly(hydroxyalkanoate) granule-associated protein